MAAIEPLTLKGKAQPVPAYQVRGSLTQELPGHGLVPANGKRPLVGRLTELREVRHQLQELSNGRGRLTVIIGEHGVGKSRLLAEAREHGEELGLRWIEATAPSHAQGLSYRLEHRRRGWSRSWRSGWSGSGSASWWRRSGW